MTAAAPVILAAIGGGLVAIAIREVSALLPALAGQLGESSPSWPWPGARTGLRASGSAAASALLRARCWGDSPSC